MDSHVNEQFVAGVEGLVASGTARPETGKVLAFSLVNVLLLYVPYQLILLLEELVTVYPLTEDLARFAVVQVLVALGAGRTGVIVRVVQALRVGRRRGHRALHRLRVRQPVLHGPL